MNKRIVSIIQTLAEREKEVTIRDLAGQHSCSERTIRNDLNSISDLLRENGLAELTLKSGGRILRDEDFGKILPEVTGGDFYSYKLSVEERKKIASSMLVASSGFLTLSRIADTLFVSRATIIGDLDDIKEYIRKNGLEVISHPSKGLRVEGEESIKRRFLLRVILGEAGDTSAAQQKIIDNQVSIQSGDPVVVRKIINEQEHVHQSYLTDDAFREVLTYLRIMIGRVEQGEYIKTAEGHNEAKYVMAQDILRLIAQYCHVHVSEPEIRYLSGILSTARYIRQQDYRPDSIRVQVITRHFAAAVSEELGVNLGDDYDFFESLSNHLESVLREEMPRYPMTPVIEEVLEDHPEVRAAADEAIPILEQYMTRKLQEIEIGYICLHICAALEKKKNREVAFHVVLACHSGIGTSHLLLERLKRNFNFRIVDIVSAHEAERIEPSQADFIISTVPLENCKLDSVIVSPLLSDEDFIRVGSKVEALRGSRNLPSRIGEETLTSKGLMDKLHPILERYGGAHAQELEKQVRKKVREYFNQSAEAEAEIFAPALHHLLTPRYIQLDVECTDWREAVRTAAQPLLRDGYIEARYIDAMIDNIEENGPYVVLCPGFAVPHEGMNQGSIKVGMNFIRLKTPVDFGEEEYDPVRYVCCLSPVDRKTHLKAFFNLVNMIQNKEFLEMLDRAATPTDAARLFERFEYE